MNSVHKIILLLVLFNTSVVMAETKIKIQKDVIKGNTELPKVLYIIPWQSTVSKVRFKGVKLDNYYEKLLVPYHPHKMLVNDNN